MAQIQSKQRVGLAGLGLMGSALADALIARGFEVAVWNRDPAKTELFARAGATVAASVPEAAATCDLLVACLLDHDSTAATLMTGPVTAALKGKALVQLATMTSQQARELGQWAENAGIACLEGQILSYPDDIRTGRGVIVCAGPADVYETCRPLLQAMAPATTHLSETRGAAAILDKSLFEILYPHYMGFLHGAAMCEAVGIPVTTYTELMIGVLYRSGVVERTIADLGARAADRHYGDALAALSTDLPALAMTVHESHVLGLPAHHLTGVTGIMQRAVDDGHGADHFASVFEQFSRPGHGGPK